MSQYQALIETIADKINQPLQFVETIVQRRGATVLKLQTKHTAYALKLAHPEDTQAARNPTELLQHEAEILAKLPMYTSFYQAHGMADETHWLLTAWQDGDNVYQIARQIWATVTEDNPNDRYIIQRDFIDLFRKIVTALQHLHQAGYLHGDVQPAHIIQTREGGLLLFDLGLAQKIDNKDAFQYLGALVYYVAPEIARQMQQQSQDIIYDIRSEIYALGVMLFMLYNNALPIDYGTHDLRQVSFDAKLTAQSTGKVRSFADVNSPPFPKLETLLSKCLEPIREERTITLDEILQDLAQD